MKKKHSYRSVDVEAVDLAALITAVVAACLVPGALEPGVCVVALDVAKTTFLAALSNIKGEVVRILRFDHPKQTMAMVRLLLELKSRNLDVHVVMEPTGTYGDAVRHQCHQRGLSVYEVSPKKTHDMAEVLDGVPSMHDAKAAVVVAKLHAMGKSRQWVPQTEEKRNLRALVDRRAIFSEPLQQHYGQLEAVLAKYWPELDDIIDVNKTRTSMALLSGFPGPECVAQAAQDAAEAIRKASRGKIAAERIEQVIAAARNSLGVPMIRGERTLVATLVDEVQRLQDQLAAIDHEIRAHVDSDPIMKRIADVVGPAAAAALLVYVGAPSQYGSAHAYEKACGLNLREFSSGTKQGELKITKRGPSKVRQLLFLAAGRRCQQDSIVRAWCEQRAAYKADLKKKALVAVMRKLVRALWSMTHDPSALQAYDSRKLFDTRRLPLNPLTTQAFSKNATQPARHRATPTGTRSDRPRQPSESRREVQVVP